MVNEEANQLVRPHLFIGLNYTGSINLEVGTFMFKCF